jgi:hypothetical protein
MSYNVKYSGSMKFTVGLTQQQLAILNKILGMSYEDHPELFGDESDYKGTLDLKLTKELDGLHWDGTPGTYGMHYIFNIIIVFMRKKAKCPNFGLVGEISEDGDHGKMTIKIDQHGFAYSEDIPQHQCPKCGHKY